MSLFARKLAGDIFSLLSCKKHNKQIWSKSHYANKTSQLFRVLLPFFRACGNRFCLHGSAGVRLGK